MIRADHDPQPLLDDRGQNSEVKGMSGGAHDDNPLRAIAYWVLSSIAPPGYLFSRRCAWDTQPGGFWSAPDRLPQLPPPARIGRIGWFVAIWGACMARGPDFLPRSLKFSCRRPAPITLSTVDSHEIARTFP